MIARLLHLQGGAAAVFILILSLTLPSSFSAHARAVSARCCVASECEALIFFKKSYLDPNGLLLSWRGEDCCGWKRVWCDNRTGHVIKLDLRGSDGQIMNSTIIAALPHLRYLDLSFNDFNYSASEPLSFLGALNNLRYLNLSYAGFPRGINVDMIGRLPQYSWSKLRELHLQGANLIGQLPAWIVNLSNLIYLGLSQNMLVGSIPSRIGNMRSLSYLDLSWNMLGGSIPSGIGNMRSLSHLDFSSNMFGGSIPSGIGNMQEPKLP